MTTSSEKTAAFPEEFLAMLACPLCEDRPGLSLGDDQQSLQCTKCKRRYPIREGIPELTEESAMPPA